MNTVFITVLALDIDLYLFKKPTEGNYTLTNSRLTFPFQKLLILII